MYVLIGGNISEKSFEIILDIGAGKKEAGVRILKVYDDEYAERARQQERLEGRQLQMQGFEVSTE